MAKFRGFQKYAYKKQKPGYYLHDFLNIKNPLDLFASKKFILGITALALITGGVILAQGPLFHSYQTNAITTSGPDPITPLWKENFINNDLSSWRTSFFASFTTTGGGNCTNPGTSTISCKGILLSPNSTNSAFALSRNPVTISTSANKVLTINLWYFFSTSTTITAGNKWLFYLTTNGTLPANEKSYDPFTDKAVSLIFRETATSATKSNVELLFQRNTQLSISDSEQSNCPLTSSCFILVTNTNLLTPVANQKNLSTNINETGAQGPSFVQVADINGGNLASTTINNQPWLDINQQYYIGVWDVFGSVPLVWSSNINSSNDCSGTPTNIIYCLSLVSYQPVIFPASAPPPAQIDTGGFFGPIIRALIAIGVFILANIISFGNYLGGLMGPVWAFFGSLAAIVLNGISSIIITLLNNLGSLIGDPNLGNQLVSVFTQIGSYITALFSRINSLVSTLITFLVNSFNFLFDVTDGFLTYWIGTVLFGILGVLVTISNIIVTVLRVFQVGFPFVVLADLLWLLSESIDHGTEGAMKWWQPHEILVVNVGKLMFVLVETLSTFIYQTIVEIEGGAADIKPEIAGFSP